MPESSLSLFTSSQILALLQASDRDPKFLLGPADLEVSSVSIAESPFLVEVFGGFCVFCRRAEGRCLQLLRFTCFCSTDPAFSLLMWKGKMNLIKNGFFSSCFLLVSLLLHIFFIFNKLLIYKSNITILFQTLNYLTLKQAWFQSQWSANRKVLMLWSGHTLLPVKDCGLILLPSSCVFLQPLKSRCVWGFIAICGPASFPSLRTDKILGSKRMVVSHKVCTFLLGLFWKYWQCLGLKF